MEFCPFAFLYLKELLLAHCFLVRGTSFSFSHLPFSLSLQKQKQPLGTADVFLRKDAALMLWNSIKALVSQNIKISLFSLGTDFFLSQAPNKYMHHDIFPSIAVLLLFCISFLPPSSTDSHFITFFTHCFCGRRAFTSPYSFRENYV